MKILVNRCFGGFRFSNFGHSLVDELKADKSALEIRTSPEIIALAEEYGEEMFSDYSDVEVAEIPDNATDFDINENDGYETIIYVINGKIYYDWYHDDSDLDYLSGVWLGFYPNHTKK